MEKDKRLKREIRKYNYENGYEFERLKRKKEQTQLILLVSTVAIMTIAAFSGLWAYVLDFVIDSIVKLFK